MSFISDQEKGIIKATADIFRGCQQCFCVKHIEKNVKNKLNGRQVVAEMWAAARCKNYQVFEKIWTKYQ